VQAINRELHQLGNPFNLFLQLRVFLSTLRRKSKENGMCRNAVEKLAIELVYARVKVCHYLSEPKEWGLVEVDVELRHRLTTLDHNEASASKRCDRKSHFVDAVV
jgi:hypothetical protein